MNNREEALLVGLQKEMLKDFSALDVAGDGHILTDIAYDVELLTTKLLEGSDVELLGRAVFVCRVIRDTSIAIVYKEDLRIILFEDVPVDRSRFKEDLYLSAVYRAYMKEMDGHASRQILITAIDRICSRYIAFVFQYAGVDIPKELEAVIRKLKAFDYGSDVLKKRSSLAFQRKVSGG